MDQPKIDYGSLFLGDRVHASVYTHPDIFEEEMEKVFHRGWCYVGHTSEIPAPGDYRVRSIGRHSVIMSRGDDGRVHLLLNRCRHRGNAVCRLPKGNTPLFRCGFHDWTYRTNGELASVSYPKRYGGDFRKEDFGLIRVPRMEIVRGFIWGSLMPTGISLDEHLGPIARALIDDFCDASPEGEIELNHGIHKVRYYGNWKFQGGDGYHAPFVHSATFGAMRLKRRGAVPGGPGLPPRGLGAGYSRDLGSGHYMLDTRETGRAFHRLPDTPPYREYVRAMERSHGKARADFLVHGGSDPHLILMPNLHLVGPQVRVVRPISVDETEIDFHMAFLKGAPDEVNVARLRTEEAFWSPAGGGNTDDVDLFERNQMALKGDRGHPWLLLSRGLESERHDADGSVAGDLTDEVTQRSQLRWWVGVMSQP